MHGTKTIRFQNHDNDSVVAAPTCLGDMFQTMYPFRLTFPSEHLIPLSDTGLVRIFLICIKKSTPDFRIALQFNVLMSSPFCVPQSFLEYK